MHEQKTKKKVKKRHEPWDAGAAPGIGRLRTLEGIGKRLRSNSGRQVLVGRCSQSGLRKWVVGAQPSGSSRLMESVKLCPLATERLACGLNQSSTGQPVRSQFTGRSLTAPVLIGGRRRMK
ncbi:hypothetical protein CISG_04154 [Coccidioides immitis RMSCC 3703]|uniref:Uncharacterized protein n=2 Tax=Coccidioides immitis TaxID=5501 RepID=A0A0J8QRT0_COCIT|nr:hypothetical protein CIRG_06587 [Coccidioides immitis RMSCC 2394]KMU75206.1 hypothetical protein CISG_04154 [Coccidioides immitis RMSCC 3703]